MAKIAIVFYPVISEAINIVYVNEPLSLKRIKSQQGFSLIEILIAFGLMGFLALVMSSLFSDMYKAQKQTNVVNTIETMRLNIIKLTNDGSPWKNTVLHGANGAIFSCMNTVSCTDSGVSTVNAMEAPASTLEAPPFMQLQRLQTGSGFTDAESYIRNTTGTEGFTERGEPCDTFNPNPNIGNDACPIRWSIRVAYECSGASCANPVMRVIGILYYHPNPNNPMKTVVNPLKYRLDIRRGSQGDVRSELIQTEYRGTGGNHGGTCADDGSTYIPLNEVSDNGGNVSGGGGTLNFNPGTYSCSATSSCFACESVRIELLVNGNPVGSSISVAAPDWVTGQASLSNVVFTINAVSPVRLRQICQRTPSSPDGNVTANMGLGIAAPPYNGTKFAELTCTRMF